MNKKILVTKQVYDVLETKAKDRDLTITDYVTSLVMRPTREKRPTPTAEYYDLENVIAKDLIVSCKAWSQLADIVDVCHYKDLGEPIREGIRLVIARNADALLARRNAIHARIIAQASAAD